MQNLNLYFNSKSQQSTFWNKNIFELPNELLLELQINPVVPIRLIKIGKVLKRNTERGYKICRNYLFYYDDANRLRAYIDLSYTYFKIIKLQPTVDFPYTYQLHLTLNNHDQILYGGNNQQLLGFISDMKNKCILLDFAQQFTVVQLIGVGATCQVFLGTQVDNQQTYAIKTVPKECNIKHRDLQCRALMQEIVVMRQMDHPNIMKFYTVYEDPKHIHLILHLFNGGTLLDKQKNFTMQVKKNLAQKLLETIECMHKQGFMHRDLKPQNIYYKNQDPNNFEFAIGDFGFATRIKQQNQVYYKCGTPGYVAPEILEYRDNQKMYSEACDIFSAGVIIYQIFYQAHPFKVKNKDDTMKLNALASFSFDDKIKVPQSLKNLLIQMLRKNPKDRFSAQQCLNHDFFKEVLNESSLDIDCEYMQQFENSPQYVRIVRCQTIQTKLPMQLRRQSLQQEQISQEPTIQRRRNIEIKHSSNASSSMEKKQRMSVQETTTVRDTTVKKQYNNIWDLQLRDVPSDFGQLFFQSKS